MTAIKTPSWRAFFLTFSLFANSTHPAGAEDVLVTKGDGYRGIWYSNQGTKDEYAFKYSGGFATYPHQHAPIAIYAKAVNKTFFCYGGRSKEKNELLHMVSYFDHTTGKVPRPTILLNKHTSDAHENPTLSIDDSGHLWIFSNSHGTGHESYIHRSKEPYSIDSFEKVVTTNFSYSQPWHLPGHGFFFLHTRYSPGRNLFWMTSPDGRTWDDPQPLAKIEMGHYQVSTTAGNRVATAFDVHPRPIGLNARTNLYYLETLDQGKTWRTAAGEVVKTPLTEFQNPALIHDYRAEKLLVYLKEVRFDAEGHPVILYLTSKGWAPGPDNGPRELRTARWTGKEWVERPFTTTDHNYDFGPLYIEPDGVWRIIAPTEPGPQAFGTGGDIVVWTSKDQGETWTRGKQLTHDSKFNHTFVRQPVNAQPDFYAIWADGDTHKPSASNLYFTNKVGDHVWKLPESMTEEFASPEVAW
jgi:hypothetical protein